MEQTQQKQLQRGNHSYYRRADGWITWNEHPDTLQLPQEEHYILRFCGLTNRNVQCAIPDTLPHVGWKCIQLLPMHIFAMLFQLCPLIWGPLFATYYKYCLWFRNVAVPLHISAQQLCFVKLNCLSYHDSSGGIYRPTTSRNTIQISTARILQSLQTMIGILLPSGLIWASQNLYII